MSETEAPGARYRMRSQHQSNIEDELYVWLDRLREVDAVLSSGAMTLVGIADFFLCPDAADPIRRKPFDALAAAKPAAERLVPPWIGERPGTPQRSSMLVHAFCCSTLQRLARNSRRWPWPGDDFAKPLQRLSAMVSGTLTTSELLSDDDVFGVLNPLTSAEMFWVLLNGGEAWAHSATGFTSMFGMLWAIFGARQAYGQSGDSRALPATIVSKCLMPLKRLEATIITRATVYRDIAAVCERLIEFAAAPPTTRTRWQSASALDRLGTLLHELAAVAINPEQCNGAAARIVDIAANIRAKDVSTKWQNVMPLIADLLRDIAAKNTALVADVETALKRIETEVVAKLGDAYERDRFRTALRPRLAAEDADAYWQRMSSAASLALAKCREGLASLSRAADVCAPLKQRRAEGADIVNALSGLAEYNTEVAELLQEVVTPAVQWTRRTVQQEVAYASAGNDTEFDAADLLSAIAIAERWDQISRLEVEDAIRKSLRAAREDGSWSTGQPFFVRNRVLGVWPNTTDIAWLLASAINGQARITVADEALVRFVDWLARNVVSIKYEYENRKYLQLSGWSTETRDSSTIDVWTTCGAVNALLEIRDLIEHRLWELCERRFVVMTAQTSLDKVDPVDVGSRHQRRLHHVLRCVARESRGPKWKSAQYSFVLHGPPGSSKTVITEALGAEMSGREQPRIVRITPADFTRRGEAGVDAEARFIFDLLSRVRRVTILFDEIDDLLRRRELKGVPSFLKMVVPAMLNRLQDLRDAAPRQEISFIVAMNYVDNIEPALMRPGRIDAIIPVVYPDSWSRENTLERIAEEEAAGSRLPSSARATIIGNTAGWPWTTYQRMAYALLRKTDSTIETSNIEATLANYETELQDTWSSYLIRDRWIPPCPQLVDEVARLAIACFDVQAMSGFSSVVDEKAAVNPRSQSDGEWQWRDAMLEAVSRRIVALTRQEDWTPYTASRPDRTDIPFGAELLPSGTAATLRVWAPDAVAVEAEIGDSAARVRLTQDEPAVWTGEIDATAGSTYRYQIDLASGERVQRNDPYARDVTPPDGAYGIIRDAIPEPSYDCPGWHELVIYQIDIRHASGTRSRALYDHLDEGKLMLLQRLGVTAIDVIAPTEYPLNEDDRYEPLFVLRRETSLGGIDGLRRLVRRAHQFQIAVITGITTKYHLGRGMVDLRNFTGNASGPYGVYFESDPARVQTPYGLRPAMTTPAVAELMIENANRWIEEVGVDGLRWDGVHFVRHPSGQRETGDRDNAGWDLLRAVNRRILLRERRTITIAIDPHEPASLVARGELGANFGAQWSPSFARTLRNVICAAHDDQRDMDVLATAINRMYGGDAFSRVVYVEARDSLGRQPRLAATLADAKVAEEDIHRLSILSAAVILLTPGIPMFLAGQEYADTERVVDWQKREKKRGVVAAFEALIRLRRNFAPGVTPGLKGHGVYVFPDNTRKVLTIHRWKEGRALHLGDHCGDEVVGVLNFSGTVQERYRAPVPYAGPWHIRYDSDTKLSARIGTSIDAATTASSDGLHVELPLGPYSVVVLSQDPPQHRDQS